MFVSIGSFHNRTRDVVDCWLSRPDFPQLDLFLTDHESHALYGVDRNAHVHAATNINVTTASHLLDPLAFGKTMAEASFFLCPSVMEGYDHYLNQARASGGTIVTSSTPPTNELISSRVMGVFVEDVKTSDAKQQQIQQNTIALSADAICGAVERVIQSTSPAQRQAMADKAHQQYHIDTAFFGRAMQQLTRLAGKQRHQQQQ